VIEMALKESMFPRDLLSVKNTARRVGCTYCTVLRWIRLPGDRLPCYRIGGRIRISESELDGWINRRSGRVIEGEA
jgi:excisionase family DNA binding protein